MKFFQLLSIVALLCYNLKVSAQNQVSATPNLYEIDVQTLIQRIGNAQNFDVQLPFPDGEWQEVRATLEELLTPELKSIYPNLRTYSLSYGDWKGKLTVGNGKIYARFRTPNGMIAILPSEFEPNKYKSYLGTFDPELSDLPPENFGCNQDEAIDYNLRGESETAGDEKSGSGFSRGGTLTTYRLAVVATGEFEDANGANSMARITSTVQGWNLIYEVDLGIRLSLVNTQIYNNPATDPFTPDNSGGDSRVNQAAEVIAMNFASNTYDVGQVFHNTNNSNGWFGGGVAGLGITCSNGTFFSTSSFYESTNDGNSGPDKGAAWSGSFENSSNGWIQLSAHELGHQFGASHTFNGSGFNCVGGNLSTTSAYEIGSGTTIMSYNGICGSGQNIPDGGVADNYFHSHSIDQILTYITIGNGSNCGNDANINNTAPTVNANPNNADYTIPARTPFELVGSANDAENDPLTYCWEQYDEDGAGTPTQGKIGSAAASDPLAPLFRSFPPRTNSKRVFPRRSAILAGDNNGRTFEALPSVNRTMTFALTVRDNNPAGGSVVCESIEIEVENTGTPFEITSQNAPTSLFLGDSNFTVTWNVAGTTGGNIQCSQVDILFSTDDGNTFPTVLANNTPNDGSQSIAIPNTNTSTGRIKIIASNNIFFDINDAPITITSNCLAESRTFSPDNNVTADQGNIALDLNISPDYDTPINDFSGNLSTSDPSSNLAFSDVGSCSGPSNSNNYEVYEFIVDASGSYTFNRTSPFGQLLNIYQGTFNPNSVCSNWLASTATRPSGTGNVNLGSSVSLNLNTNTTYSLVVSTFSTNGSYYGNYNVTYNGTGQILEQGTADPGFAYTYVIVNNGNNIVAIEDNPDLRNYVVGTYTIYGLERSASISTTSLNNDYANGAFGALQNDINSGTICGALSSNTKTVTVNQGNNNGGNTTLNSETYSNQTITVQVCGTLSATSKIINGSDVTFIATDAVVLRPGFVVEAGSDFEARLQSLNCSNEETEIEARTFLKKDLTLFPNPTNGFLQWKLEGIEQLEEIQLFDQLGKRLISWRLPQQQLDISQLPNGVYFMLLKADDQVYQRRVVKQ